MSSRAGLRPVKVQVAGQTLALRTDATAAYLRQLAAMVDARLAQVRDQHGAAEPGAPRRAVSTQALALLCALQLADELRQAEAAAASLRREVRAGTARILEHLALLDPAGAPPSPRVPRRRGRRAAARVEAP
jgi:cell division protein ZapA (FtsZ GTPase activity inhibitor)